MRKTLIACLALALMAAMLLAPMASADTVASASTPLDDASSAQLTNIGLAAEALQGVNVGVGDTFSFNDIVGPRTRERGYKSAVNGRGANVMGGGVSQAAATLYLALKQLDDIEYIEKETYGKKFTGSYVDSGNDAIVTDYNGNVDFSFLNDYGDFTIEMWIEEGELCCLIDDENSGGGSSGGSTIDLTGNSAQRHNIVQASLAIDGMLLESGDVFSFNDTVGPRTEGSGYRSALNGRGAKTVGGGVAQVASALWLAVKDMFSVTVIEMSTYGDAYNQTYVDSADDAVLVDYQNDTDFRFRYDGDGTLAINVYVQNDEFLVCDIYEE